MKTHLPSINPLALSTALALSLLTSNTHAHYDIAPYFQNNQLLTGGLDHQGHTISPTIYAYAYDFGEEPLDPFNPTDPGINQQASVGNLPATAALRFNILSNLTYWNGSNTPTFTPPSSNTYIDLTLGSTTRTLNASSGPQTGGLIQSVAANGSVHKHFITSLFHSPGSSNIPGDTNYLTPPDGIYAWTMQLTLTHQSITYTSNPFYIIFNQNLTEEIHDLALNHLQNTLIPEPATFSLLLLLSSPLFLRKPRI